MKMVLGVASVFVYFHLVSPVQMFYLYDETPNTGFVGEASKDLGIITKGIFKPNREPPYSIRGTYSAPVKYGIARRFQKESSHPIDSHFKVLKTSTKADKVVKMKGDQRGADVTNRPHKEQRKFIDDTNKNIEPRNYNSMTVNAFVSQNYGQDEKVLNAGVPQTKSYIKMSKNDPYLINIHKTQVTSEQKLKLNSFNNQFSNNRRAENEMSAIEKAQQKMTNLEEANSQAKSKYDQVINKKLDRRHYDALDYLNNNVKNPGSITNVVAITNRPTAMAVINSITEKDKYKVNVRGGGTPRIGSWEESIDDVRPYALFYRISQDSNKRHYIGSAGNVQHFINDDDSEFKSEKFVDQDMIQNVQPTNSPNAFKLKMKMKKYSNFRTH